MNVTQNVPDGFLTTINPAFVCSGRRARPHHLGAGCPGKGPRTGAEESRLTEQVRASGLAQAAAGELGPGEEAAGEGAPPSAVTAETTSRKGGPERRGGQEGWLQGKGLGGRKLGSNRGCQAHVLSLLCEEGGHVPCSLHLPVCKMAGNSAPLPRPPTGTRR